MKLYFLSIQMIYVSNYEAGFALPMASFSLDSSMPIGGSQYYSTTLPIDNRFGYDSLLPKPSQLEIEQQEAKEAVVDFLSNKMLRKSG